MTTNDYYLTGGMEVELVPLADPTRRSPALSLLFLPSVLLAAMAWMSGMSFLTDMAFVVLAIVCAIAFFFELYVFPARFGIGGLVLFGGTLIWFCEDYFQRWVGMNFSYGGADVGAVAIAKATFYHCLFLFFATLAIPSKAGQRLEKWLLKIPDPGNSTQIYFVVFVLLMIIGLIPYAFFTRDPIYVSIYRQIFAGRGGHGGVAWTVGCTGNVNHNFGAYLAQVIQVGEMGGILGSFYAIYFARSLGGKIFGWLCWLLWFLMGFGSGTRGSVVFMAMPVVGFLFLKYQSEAQQLLKKISFKAYIISGIFGLIMFAFVQLQGRFRNLGFKDADVSSVSMSHMEGNSMFTESLIAFKLIPRDVGYFEDDFPGETIIRPIPDQIFWFCVAPMPRAIWSSKPIDPTWVWYNAVVTGDPNGAVGTTISQGLVGAFFIRYGIFGVIEGGLLFGWLCGLTERILRQANGRGMPILVSLGLATWLFRCFRGITYPEIDELMVGIGAMAVLIVVCRRFFSAPAPQQ